MTCLAEAAPGSGLMQSSPAELTDGRACGCSLPLAHCPLLQWTVQSVQPSGQRLEQESRGKRRRRPAAPGIQSWTPLERGSRHSFYPITQGSPGGCIPHCLPWSLSLSFPSAAVLLPFYCHPPAPPPVIHGWCVAIMLYKWALSHLEDRLQVEGSKWLWGGREPWTPGWWARGTSRALLTCVVAVRVYFSDRAQSHGVTKQPSLLRVEGMPRSSRVLREGWPGELHG